MISAAWSFFASVKRIRDTLSEKPENTVRLVRDSATHKQKTMACLDERVISRMAKCPCIIILRCRFIIYLQKEFSLSKPQAMARI